jgi:hypothetical protein
LQLKGEQQKVEESQNEPVDECSDHIVIRITQDHSMHNPVKIKGKRKQKKKKQEKEKTKTKSIKAVTHTHIVLST